MKKYLIPVLTIVLCAAVLLGAAFGLQGVAEKNAQSEHLRLLETLAPGAEGLPTMMELFLGMHGGTIGETCAIALLLGGAYLIIRRVITWHIPVSFIGTVALMSLVCGQDALAQVLSGGLLLAAIFMATDYGTSPITKLGQIVYGIGCGLLTVAIRYFGSYNEGVSYAILVMNACVVLLDRIGRPTRYGAPRKEAAKK